MPNESHTPGLSVTLLGTGGPRPNPDRSQASTVIEFAGARIVVDLGEGASGQMLAAGIDPAEVRSVLFTHLHWDHVLGYPGFVWGGWAAGRQELTVRGPEGTRRHHERVLESAYDDQARWAESIGFPPQGWWGIDVADIGDGRLEQLLSGLTITAAFVEHPPVKALAYRFEAGGRSIVVSGDTLACPSLLELSRDADILVMDACAPLSDAAPPAAQRLADFHADAREGAQLAAEAGVRTLILSHVTGMFDQASAVEACREVFSGDIVVGRDLCTYRA